MARYLPNSLTQLHTLGLTGQEIPCHGQDVLQIVANCCDIEENACPQPLYHLINHPQYREAFKAVKTLTKGHLEKPKPSLILLIKLSEAGRPIPSRNATNP
ncbi:hypothetical protein [Arsenophonus sp. ENCA]|uniref:hypothetical protein n=1 Tax=Arsenophonus sp. ENCA TaxID=1987579 RepID=UPI0025C2C758|nr:hypothetical protein [Arsenophonus sp. ENCA]